jgi:hypothetical protein
MVAAGARADAGADGAAPIICCDVCPEEASRRGLAERWAREDPKKESEGFCGQADDGFSGLTVIIIGPGETTTTSDPSTATLLHIRLLAC